MLIKMKNVRLSFPSLFSFGTMNGESTGKYEATFVLDKTEHADVIKDIRRQIKSQATANLKGKVPPAEKLCLKDGDDMERPEYEGKMTVKASCKKRPLLIDRDKSPIVEADNKVYAGCYVNAIISLWTQDNKWGKRINAQFEGLQFSAHGEPFGDGGVSADEFDAFGDDEDEDIDAFDDVDEDEEF